jgi:hypothetical protein
MHALYEVVHIQYTWIFWYVNKTSIELIKRDLPRWQFEHQINDSCKYVCKQFLSL